MSEKQSENSNNLDELDWIRVYENIRETNHIESLKEKFARKIKENPAVPIGTLLTISAFSYGMWNFYQGNALRSQYMMRARVALQGLTILSIVVGFMLTTAKTP